jgi:glycosyltransferase involved in cell wall biosynthesis
MQALDVFVLPSLAEGISNTILEAMATGLPVVATRVGGNAELVDDRTTGTLVPAGDIDAMAGAMHRYAISPAMLRQHGEAGRVRAERCFSLDTMVGQYETIYDSLLRGLPGSGRGMAAAQATTGGH